MSRKHARRTRNGLRSPRRRRPKWQRRGIVAGDLTRVEPLIGVSADRR